MKRKTRTWTKEQREAQSIIMKERKAWLKSTGPKSDEGKQKVRDNALKHGMRSAEAEELRRLLYAQRMFVNRVMQGVRL